MAPPSSRVASLAAEATPALSSAVDMMIFLVAGAVARATPAPRFEDVHQIDGEEVDGNLIERMLAWRYPSAHAHQA